MYKKRSTKIIYLDNFSLLFVILNFKDSLKNELIIIEELSQFNKLIIQILIFFGLSISESKYVAGHLNYKNENVFLKAREIAGKLSIECSTEIVNSSETILNLNKEFKEGTIELFISRYLQLYVEKWIMNILIIKSINKLPNSDFKIFLSKPYIFNEKLISNYFLDSNIHFYSNNFLRNLKIYFLFITSKLSTIKFLYHAIIKRSKNSFKEQQNSVLCIQNDTVSLNRKKRGQPHWIEKNNINDYNTYVLSFGYSNSPKINDEKELSNNNCYVIYPSIFLDSYRANKRNEVLKLIFKTIKKINFKFWSSYSYQEKYHLLQISKLLMSSYLISSIAIYLKTKVFIINEPQSIYSDALVLVSNKLALKTIALQYSNMSMIAPLMMSNANIFCVFSELYKSVFSYKNIKPDKYIVTGYLYNGLKDYISKDSTKIKNYFKNLNVDFIVSYFDENICIPQKLALYNKSDHENDIERLASAVIEDNKLGIIIKTQFNYNSPTVLYPNNLIIQKALKTGRLIDIGSGEFRNDIFAAQVALASDLCVGHSYGSTASLEAAVYGVKSVLITHYNSSSKWDYLYNQNNILFDSMETLIKIVLNKSERNYIGDWNNIIHKFDCNQEFLCSEKLNTLIDNNIN